MKKLNMLYLITFLCFLISLGVFGITPNNLDDEEDKYDTNCYTFQDDYLTEYTAISKTNIFKNRQYIVDDEGDGDYTSIQTAIDHANNGDTIMVFSGYYPENLCIEKEIFLIGIEEEFENGTDTGKPVVEHWDWGGDFPAIDISTNNMTFFGFDVR
ncbi:MAG TPA: hypothetical protein ENI51_05290, partial [Candidatus Atribacteria bacterium]|nr:hypothetical protein [Candidatus Atribacteria bacterium]